MQRSRGFSLLELLIVLAIIAILAGLSGNLFSDAPTRNHTGVVASNIFRALQAARAKSRLDDRSYSICGSNDGSNCSRQWQKQLLLFADENANLTADSDEIVYQFPVNARQFEVQTRIGFGRLLASFSARGYAEVSGSFLLCSKGSTTPQPLTKVTRNAIGRPYILRTAADIARHSSMTCL